MQTELGAALPLWGLSSRSTVSFLSHSENTTFLARDPASGRRLVLRVQPDRLPYVRRDQVRARLDRTDGTAAMGERFLQAL
ncbi:hypothetical protein [Bradyrhizobium sp. Bra78]|uniref:hypothetical protein n=1 Tax=Bradyrhizobium sp. Bra78 TaxID=2926010 RepID=UPI0021CACD02|nr:hypothetical protein [Bradyrhizobium sp. Bra78]